MQNASFAVLALMGFGLVQANAQTISYGNAATTRQFAGAVHAGADSLPAPTVQDTDPGPFNQSYAGTASGSNQTASLMMELNSTVSLSASKVNVSATGSINTSASGPGSDRGASGNEHADIRFSIDQPFHFNLSGNMDPAAGMGTSDTGSQYGYVALYTVSNQGERTLIAYLGGASNPYGGQGTTSGNFSGVLSPGDYFFDLTLLESSSADTHIGSFDIALVVDSIPEPSVAALAGLGLLPWLMHRRSSRQKRLTAAIHV